MLSTGSYSYYGFALQKLMDLLGHKLRSANIGSIITHNHSRVNSNFRMTQQLKLMFQAAPVLYSLQGWSTIK
jgi:hypothetical protein